jgi:hypothetical protein
MKHTRSLQHSILWAVSDYLTVHKLNVTIKMNSSPPQKPTIRHIPHIFKPINIMTDFNPKKHFQSTFLMHLWCQVCASPNLPVTFGSTDRISWNVVLRDHSYLCIFTFCTINNTNTANMQTTEVEMTLSSLNLRPWNVLRRQSWESCNFWWEFNFVACNTTCQSAKSMFSFQHDADN